MAEATISYKGKVKVKEPLKGKDFMELLDYLVNDCGFSMGKIEEDEVKLIKTDEFTNAEIKIEIECSDKDFEIEIKTIDIETVKKLTEDLAEKIK